MRSARRTGCFGAGPCAGCGRKIRISGGGRCNFTNLYAGPENFISANPHFCKSALARYSQWDFIDLMGRHGIAWHEKTLGQLFCDGSAKEIVAMLLSEMDRAGAQMWLNTRIETVTHGPDGFALTVYRGDQRHTLQADNLVLATGGKSIPKMGATGLAYDIARRFGHTITDTRPALVPLTFPDSRFAPLSGLSLPVRAGNARTHFDEALLFTHRGLSGPAILQISSYWREGEAITIDLIPQGGLFDSLRAQRQREGRRQITTELAQHLPARLIEHLAPDLDLTGRLADWSDARLHDLETALRHWAQIRNKPNNGKTLPPVFLSLPRDML